MVVAIGAAQLPGEAPSPVDMNDIQQTSATHSTGAPFPSAICGDRLGLVL